MKDTRFSVRPLRWDYETYSPFLSYTITTNYVKPHTKNLIRRTTTYDRIAIFQTYFLYICVYTKSYYYLDGYYLHDYQSICSKCMIP